MTEQRMETLTPRSLLLVEDEQDSRTILGRRLRAFRVDFVYAMPLKFARHLPQG
jgi:hypothetical protein